MKQFLPLFSLTAILGLVLIGCGGRPASFMPNGMAASNIADSGGAPSSNSNPAVPAPAPAGQSSALPTPPSSAVVYNQIQNTPDNWTTCSVCAQGTNVTTNYWMAPNQSSPSMSGSSRQFYVGGPQWTNALFIKTYYDHLDTTNYLWDFYIYWDSTSMANIWTAEFDFWQVTGGKEFMIGSQCNFGDGYWDIWDQAANKWLHSNVTCSRMAPNQWHHIQWYLYRDGNTYHYDTLVVDGTPYNINRTFSPTASSWQPSMGVQWQLDQSNSGVDLHEWIDNVKLTVW